MPVMLFPVPGILEVFVLPLLLFKFRVMTLPGSVPFVGRDKLVAHFMINSEFQNTQGYKVLLQPRMNPDEFFSLIVGAISKPAFVMGFYIASPHDLRLNPVIEILLVQARKDFIQVPLVDGFRNFLFFLFFLPQVLLGKMFVDQGFQRLR